MDFTVFCSEQKTPLCLFRGVTVCAPARLLGAAWTRLEDLREASWRRIGCLLRREGRSVALRSVARSLDRSVARSLDPDRSVARSLDRSMARSVDRWIARSFDRSITRSLDHSIARSIARSLARLLDCEFIRSLIGCLNCSLDRALDCAFVRLLVALPDRSLV